MEAVGNAIFAKRQDQSCGPSGRLRAPHQLGNRRDAQAFMTTLAFGEQLGRFLESQADRIETERAHDKVIHLVMIGKQVFVVTCEESTPDAIEPAV